MKNIGLIDQIIRGILGLFFVYLSKIILGKNFILSAIIFIVALILIITALTGFCPLYKIFGFNTRRKK